MVDGGILVPGEHINMHVPFINPASVGRQTNSRTLNASESKVALGTTYDMLAARVPAPPEAPNIGTTHFGAVRGNFFNFKKKLT